MPSRHTGSPDEVRALSAYINLARAFNSLTVRVHRHLADADLTASQLAVIEMLYHCGPAVQKHICGKLLTSSGNVTFVIDGLEKRGLVRRQRLEDDKRCIRVELTEKGLALIERVFPRHAATVAAELSVLNEAEQEQLRQLCRKLGKGEADGCGTPPECPA